MKMTQEAEVVVETLKEHEQALARLYEVYAEKFPEHEEFWTELAHEEVQHANWLVILRDRIEKNDEDFAVERLLVSTSTVICSQGHVSDIINIAALFPTYYRPNAILRKIHTKKGKFLDKKNLRDDVKTIEELYAVKEI